MTSGAVWAVEGHPVVELRAGRSSYNERDRIGAATHIDRLTQTLIITADGGRYNRLGHWPIRTGQWGSVRLVSAHDPRVLVIRAQEHLTNLATLAGNLSRLDRKSPEDVVADLAQVQRAAHDSHRAVAALMAAASRSEQGAPDGSVPR